MKIEVVDYRGKNRAYCYKGATLQTLRITQDDGTEHEFNVPVVNISKGDTEVLAVVLNSLNLQD